MKLLLPALAAAGLSLSAASPALADAAAGLKALKENNLIVLGNLVNSSEVEGRTFVGGTLTGSSNYYNNNGKTVPTSAWPGLTVVGGVGAGNVQVLNSADAWIGGSQGTTNSGALNMHGGKLILNGDGHDISLDGGSAQIAGTVSGNFNKNGGATVTPLSGIDQASFATSLTDRKTALATDLGDLSTYLKGLTKTNDYALTGPANTINFDLTGGSGALAVYKLSDASLLTGGIGTINFLTGAYDTVIVDVGGADVNITANFAGSPSGLGQHVIWNFYEATNITFASGFYGSVLAPLAQTASTASLVEGSAAFGGKLTENGEFHLSGYTGNLRIPPPVTPPPPTSGAPEPAAWALMLGGFGFAGGALRRRRRLAA